MKKITTFILLLLVIGNLYGQQTPPTPPQLMGLGIVSPDVASLGKFGTIPVSYTTGIPQVTIPIYTIKINNIALPLSLDYHAGGVRVDEISSSVGIGWALNAGGVIARAMHGYPDEMSSGYLNAPPLAQLYNNQPTYADFIYQNTEGLNDVTPDVFTYTAGEANGRFIIKQADHSFIEFPLSNNRIENYNNVNYKITDAKGVGYIYEQTEQTWFGDVNGVNLIPRYNSAWRLTKIVSSDKADTIFISYDTGTSSTHNKVYSHTIGTMPDCSSAGGSPGGTLINSDSYSPQLVQTTESYPKEIDWRGGKVIFTNVADRTDHQLGKRLSTIEVYAKTGGNFNLIKRAKLIQSYFYYLPSGYSVPVDPGNESLYRLRLDSVKFIDVTGNLKPQVYAMTYDNTPMAPRESCGQDVWGFNNGQFSNQSLMPVQSVYFDPNQLGTKTYYTFGNAKRDVDANYIKACSIQSITYPTGGKTVFTLEPHQFTTNVDKMVTSDVVCRADGSVRTTTSTTMTVTSDMLNLRYIIDVSAYNVSPPPSNRPMVSITDQATGQMVFSYTNMDASSSYFSGVLAFNNNVLQVGHTYTLTASTYVLNQSVHAELDVMYDKDQNVTLTLQGGGLRVNSITNYDANGNFLDMKSYSYNSDGNGTLLTPYNYFATNYKNLTYRIGCTSGTADASVQCMYATGKPSITYYASTVLPISQFGGSPVLYGQITEFEKDATGKANGKKVFSYQVFQDQQALANNDFTISGYQMITNDWKNGYLTGEDTYKVKDNGYYLIQSKWHNFTFQRIGGEQGIRISPKYSQIINGTTCENYTASNLSSDVELDSFNIPYSAILLQSDTTTTITDNGSKIKETVDYTYDDPSHLFPTSKQSYDSNGYLKKEVMKYTNDFASSAAIYQTMLNQHQISAVISDQVLCNGNQTTLTNTNYTDWFNTGTVLMPQSVQTQSITTNPLETRIIVDKMDHYSNLLQKHNISQSPVCYLWGYNNLYPIAEIKNANYQDVVTVLGQSVIDQLNNNTPDDNKLRNTLNSLRTAPALKDALVTTYTYSPLVGITSSTDAKGLTSYYEYDGFQRLMNIKDKDGNIVKHIDYHYQGQ